MKLTTLLPIGLFALATCAFAQQNKFEFEIDRPFQALGQHYQAGKYEIISNWPAPNQFAIVSWQTGKTLFVPLPINEDIAIGSPSTLQFLCAAECHLVGLNDGQSGRRYQAWRKPKLAYGQVLLSVVLNRPQQYGD